MINQTIGSLETQEISLRLEHYDDIFSDFDMRPYDKRALSVDFLDEIKRATKDNKSYGIDLVLNVPAASKNESHEPMIQERLAMHFARHFDLLQKEKSHVLKLGISMVILGVISMVAATIVMFEDPGNSLLFSFLIVFLEPAAWFLLWEGMDQIVFNSKNINPDLEFYRKMHNSSGRVSFNTY